MPVRALSFAKLELLFAWVLTKHNLINLWREDSDSFQTCRLVTFAGSVGRTKGFTALVRILFFGKIAYLTRQMQVMLLIYGREMRKEDFLLLKNHAVGLLLLAMISQNPSLLQTAILLRK